MRDELRVVSSELRVCREAARSASPRSRLPTRNCRRSGFTLIEALLSAVLIVMGIAGALGAISAGVRAKAAADFYASASLLAQQKMAEIEAAPALSAGEEKGDFGEDHPGYQWRYTVEEGPEGLWLVRLRIMETAQSGRPREAEVTTYLLRRG